MNITLNIEAGNPVELHEAITGLAGIMSGTVAPQPKSEKAKPNSRVTTKLPDPKPTTDADPSSEAMANTPDTAAEEPMESEEPSTETETEEIPTVVELRAAAQEKGGTPEGKKAIKALLDEIGSKNLTEIPEEKRAAFIQKLGEIK